MRLVQNVLAFVGLAIGLLLTFPPVMDLIRADKMRLLPRRRERWPINLVALHFDRWVEAMRKAGLPE